LIAEAHGLKPDVTILDVGILLLIGLDAAERLKEYRQRLESFGIVGSICLSVSRR